MFKSLSTSLIARGILALAAGVIALAWPSVTVLALVILFALYAFIAAGLQAARAFSSATAGPVFGHLLLALADLAAGVIALAWPGPTALVLVLIVGVWAVIAGLAEIAVAFAAGEPAGTRAMFILAGLATAAFGVVLCARPGLGAVTLALLFGLFNLIYGAWMLVQGIELRRTGKTLHSAPSSWRGKTASPPAKPPASPPSRFLPSRLGNSRYAAVGRPSMRAGLAERAQAKRLTPPHSPGLCRRALRRLPRWRVREVTPWAWSPVGGRPPEHHGAHQLASDA
jgi:uncharacterized membrane protein HdeD (DUF308 family)